MSKKQKHIVPARLISEELNWVIFDVCVDNYICQHRYYLRRENILDEWKKISWENRLREILRVTKIGLLKDHLEEEYKREFTVSIINM